MNKCVILFLATALSALAAEPALKVSLLDNDVLCLRASRLPDDFAEQFQAAQPTNKVSGTILDLRFADGGKNISAGKLASGKPRPLVILVNSQTRAGAAALVAQLRAAGQGIVIGSTNAAGNITPDITVAVDGEAEKKFQENPFMSVPEKVSGASVTNDLLPFVDHMSEAELVSQRVKDGELDEPSTPRAEPARPVIRDPALARAVDLLKALAILKQPHG